MQVQVPLCNYNTSFDVYFEIANTSVCVVVFAYVIIVLVGALCMMLSKCLIL